MPVPSVIGDLSTTPSLNSPAGSDNLSTTDDYLRAIQGIVKTVYDAQTTINSAQTTTNSTKLSTTGGTLAGLLNLAASANIASASTVDLTAATGNVVSITGTTTVTAFTMNAGQQMVLIAAGALPLTYNATTMNINGGVSYTCAAGDRLIVIKDLANVIRVNVIKQDGTALVSSTPGAATSTTQGIIELLIDAEYVTGTDTTRALTASVARANNIIADTAKATTSGATFDFTGIPSWVKEIDVLFSGFSTNGTSLILVQIGDSGGIETSGYAGRVCGLNTAVNAFSAGFTVTDDHAAGDVLYGTVTLKRLDSASNLWVESGILARSDAANVYTSAGSKSLSATLDRVRVTTVNGTDAGDAGTINVLYR